jgi:Ca-activated chloride channel family protein
MHYRELIRAATIVVIVSSLPALLIRSSNARPNGQEAAQEPADRPAVKSGKQDPQEKKTPADPDGSSIKIQTEMVQLDVKVVDASGKPIWDLTKNDFEIYEDKVKQEIESVSREEVPVSMGLVIDTSGSMRTKLRIVTEAARGFIRRMRPVDETFLAQFKTETELLKGFTPDQSALEEALGDLYVNGGTALLDAIIASADHASQKGNQRRKAIIVITDGVEKNSSMREKQVLQAMKEDEVQLYLVGFLDEKDSGGFFGLSANEKAKQLLIRLSEDSGGRAYFPKAVSEMPAIAGEIARELRMQYVISYYPRAGAPHTSDYHSLRVVVNPKDKRKLIARTRQGYYARGEKR